MKKNTTRKSVKLKVLKDVQGQCMKSPSQRRDEEEVEDAKVLARCQEKRKDWMKHWQCGTEVQCQENRPWKNEELKKLEEDLPRLTESNLAKAYKSENGSRLRWLSPQSSRWWCSWKKWSSVENGPTSLHNDVLLD